MKLLVYGSHKGEWDCTVGQELDFMLKLDRSLFLVLPFEPGVCAAAWRWAERNNVPYEKFVSDVFTHGDAAGFMRSEDIVKSGIDHALFFEGGYFHKTLAFQCERRGIPMSRVARGLPTAKKRRKR